LKKLLYILFLIQISLLTIYAQPVTQEWAVRYNRFSTLDDMSVAIAVDKYGNSFVTGSCNTETGGWEVATVKYNTQGQQQWAKVFYDPTQQDNLAIGIATDTLGNIFVTGYSGYSYTGTLYSWIVKYNTNGDSLWVRKNYGSESLSVPQAIITDKAGNVYLTGKETQQQMFTIKYNTNGDTLWKRVQIESGYQGNMPRSIAIDASGNVYVGGIAWVLPSSPYWNDFMIVKYNSAGAKQWSKTYGISNQNEYANRIAVDKSSNVIITGYQENPTTIYDYLTIKYSSSGVEQWVRTYHRNIDYANDVITDQLNNIIVTGQSNVPGNGSDYCTIKYNPSGDSQWVRIYNGSSNLQDIAYYVITDSSDNIYVTGNSKEFSNIGYLTTIKYSSTGVQLWLMQYIGAMQGGIIPGQGIAISSYRNIFVFGGNNQNGTGGDFITIKYAQLVGLNSLNSEIPEDFKLYQNYPNPFNPVTKIKFDIPLSRGVSEGRGVFVILTIYDILSREIAVLVNQQLKPGTYEVEWDASTYTSGVYFYRLNTGDYTETKKMVLLK